MHVEILSEDKSGAVVVERLTRQILDDIRSDYTLKVRPHRGCGSLPKDWDEKPLPYANSLLGLLPAELRAYNKVLESNEDILIVVMDSDDHNPDELRNQLYMVCRQYATDIRTVVGLCTEEVESWMLGDVGAIIKTYPEADIGAMDDYVQDSVCGSWEKLCEVVCPDDYRELIAIGYPAIGNYKAGWAENLSKNMNYMDNVSPSFILYKNALIAAIKDPTAINKPRVRRTSF